MKKLTGKKARKICQDFANKHKIVFEDSGECGFGRECVGFLHGGNYVNYCPTKGPNYERIKEFDTELVYPPNETPNAYHKHDCLAVLGRGDAAIIELAHWVLSMESKGRVEIVSYETGATGLQAVFSGLIGYAVMVYPNN